MTLQVGANASQSIAFTIGTVSASDLGISGIAVSSAASASAAIASLDAAISTVTTAGRTWAPSRTASSTPSTASA